MIVRTDGEILCVVSICFTVLPGRSSSESLVGLHHSLQALANMNKPSASHMHDGQNGPLNPFVVTPPPHKVGILALIQRPS
jgi:hypothetical protein